MQQAVLFHTHGLGGFDFSALTAADLPLVNSLAADRNVLVCPTVYLTEDGFSGFSDLLESFGRLKRAGHLERILGFAIEGPLLGPKGGTPTGSVWRPTGTQWREIASWFSRGLKYVVMSPDILSLHDDVDDDFTFSDLIMLMYSSGGRVALGHFEGRSPAISAKRLVDLLDCIEASFEPSPYLILTDHLFNDMPRAFRHAFRTVEECAGRQAELAKHGPETWKAASLADLLGPVPAALLMAARQRRLTPSLNFDGGHVDLAICQLTVEFLGIGRIIAMTDHTEVLTLAGEPLSLDAATRLLYRADGVLAASSVRHEEQLQNMRTIGMSPTAIALALYETPLEALMFEPCPRKAPGPG